jgi:hypothetical protein
LISAPELQGYWTDDCAPLYQLSLLVM